MKWVFVFAAAAILLPVHRLPASGETNVVARAAGSREWAKAVQLTGLPNLHKVNDRLYRGAQPTAEGMAELKKLGVKTVISLRAHHDDDGPIAGTGLTSIRIPMDTWRPTNEHVIRFLQVVTDPRQTPVFVHCQHGADRTGAFCAIYRVVIDGWTKEEAIEEMTQGGFGFHKVWTNLIEFIQKLDIAAVKEKLRKHE